MLLIVLSVPVMPSLISQRGGIAVPSKEPYWCEVKTWCEESDGAVAHARYFCFTEAKYVCEEDNKFCHNKAHNWRDLNEKEREGRAFIGSDNR
jgi:hypothetical protein